MKTRLLSILCFLLMSLGIQAHNLEPLHVDGRYLKNSKGDIMTLHGFNSVFRPDAMIEGYGWEGYDAATCLKNKKAALDEILKSGWKMDYVRLLLDLYWCIDEGKSIWDPDVFKAFDFNRFKKYFEELFLPMIDYYHEKGIYTLLLPPIGPPEWIENGDEFQRHMLLVWDYVSSHPRIRNNPGIMFELANEPVSFNCHQVEKYEAYWGYQKDSSPVFKEARDYWQPVVDIIRSHCDNIIYVPGLKGQEDHVGFSDYPVKGSNIGYAVHCYPGAVNLHKDWENHKFPAAYVAPIIITETAWYAGWFYLDGKHGTTSEFGIPLKSIIDELGNVSWNCSEGEEDYYFLVNSSSATEKAVRANNPEVCIKPIYQWWNEYSKTKTMSTSQLRAKSVSFDEFPKVLQIGKKELARIKAEFTNGMIWDVSGDAEYTIADESVLSINHGVIRALKDGSTSVTVKYTDGTGQTFSHKFEVTSTLFPLTKEGFDPGDGTFDETTGTFSSVGYNMGGWSFNEGLDFSPYKYLVVQLNQEQQCWTTIRIGDDKNEWDENDAWNDNTENYGFGFNDATELVIDLQSLHKKNGEPLDLSHICHVGIWINGEFGSVSIKRAFLSNDGTTAAYQEPTCVYADQKAIYYGDDFPALTYSVSGPPINGIPTLSTTANSVSSAGTYPITIGRGSVTDERVSFIDGELTIFKAPLTVGVQDVTITEGDAIPTFILTYDGLRNNDNESNALTTKPTVSTDATSYSLPGTYPIIVSGGESTNYALNYKSGTLTILEFENPASYRTFPLSLDRFHEWDGCTATSKIVNYDYQGEIHVGEKLSSGELIYGDMAVYHTHYADVTKYDQLLIEGTPGMELRVLLNRLEVGNGGGDGNGGSWTELNPVIGTDGKAIVDLPELEFVHLNAIKTGWGSPEGIIEGLYLVKGKIEKPVTITANDLTMVYGDDMPTLTYSSEGGELKGTPKLSTIATKNSPVGTYPIKVEKGTVTNEKVTYVEGTLTITQAPLTVSVQDVTITEGNAIPSFTLTYSGFKNGDTESNAFTMKPTATTTATSSSTPGTYPITVSGGTATNYALTYMQGTLTIKEKPVEPATVTANDQTMVYGDDVPMLTYKSSGAKLNGTPKLSTTATKNSPVGTYPIKVEKGTVTNEKVSFVDGTLTIIQAPLTVGVVDVTITEGEDIPTFTLKYSGFRNNDYANRAFTKKPTATTTATSSSAPGTYPITISGGEAKNYELTYKPGTLTIEPAAGIEGVYADGQGNAVIYNVNGQKLSKPKKGINIIGGKKVVVK